MNHFSITQTVKTYPRTLPYQKIKERILGKKYSLSLAFIGSQRATTLNQAYRQKDYTPNVLSFPLTPTTGEILICPSVTKREAAAFQLSEKGYVGYLFIHAALHLKGYEHGATMEKLERKYLTEFKIK